MLMLGLQLELGPGRHPLPEHLGGVLHGVVEAALLAHAPQTLALLRPQGDQALARFALQAPPPQSLPDTLEGLPITFGITLFGPAAVQWPALVDALLLQASKRIQGRSVSWLQVDLHRPGSPAPVLAWSRQAGWCEAAAAVGDAGAQAPAHPLPGGASCRLHRIDLHSPLLLASRSAAREQLAVHGQLPWPSLGSVLDSMAQRLITLEPALAAELGLIGRAGSGVAWSAGPEARSIAPLTPADQPARQVQWTYQASARSRPGSPPRRLVLPGITGSLIYPASADAPRCRLEAALLYWGQWLGLGQKTTLGCGRFTWTPLP